MFDTKKFGGYLSRLRKKADMTQNELADRLNLTRQAISRYEMGDSFPDVSILMLIAEIFGTTLDELIKSGGPTHGESIILENIARGNSEIVPDDIRDVVGLAPILKPSVLEKLSKKLEKRGIDINNIIELAKYLNDDGVISLLENTQSDEIDDEVIEMLIPILDDNSKSAIFEKIIDGEMDWHMIKVLLPYAEFMMSQIEYSVIEGALPEEVLKITHDYTWSKELKRQQSLKINI